MGMKRLGCSPLTDLGHCVGCLAVLPDDPDRVFPIEMEKNMSATALDVISGIIVDVCGLDRARLAPGANAVDDLGIDSVDFLDIIYEIDRHYGIKLPAEAWMEQINSGKATTADFFVLERFAANVEAHAKSSGSAHPSA